MASQLDFADGAHDRREPQRASSIGETLLMVGLFVAGLGAVGVWIRVVVATLNQMVLSGSVYLSQ
jgi:hypothetical protein